MTEHNSSITMKGKLQVALRLKECSNNQLYTAMQC